MMAVLCGLMSGAVSSINCGWRETCSGQADFAGRGDVRV